MNVESPKNPYVLIWSFEHKAWWAENRCGYVTEVSKAGRYPLTEACQIIEQANFLGCECERIVLINSKLSEMEESLRELSVKRNLRCVS